METETAFFNKPQTASPRSRTGRTLILCGAPKQPTRLVRQAEFHHHVGADNICPNIEAALLRAAAVRALAT